MRIGLTSKLVASYLLVAGLIVAPPLWYLHGALLQALERSEAKALKPRLEALRHRLNGLADDELATAIDGYATLLQLRLSVIDRDGTLRADSEIPRARLAGVENHGHRTEFRDALKGPYGYHVRRSETVNAELIYGAVPMPAEGRPQAVLRGAQRVSYLRDSVTRALLTLRVAAGIGMTAALLLSLAAALRVSAPLRRMRDAALAFAQLRWVAVEQLRSGDELEELAAALQELGLRLQEQLTAAGAAEALLHQTVRAMPEPALLLDQSLGMLAMNGPLRERTGITPEREPEVVGVLLDTAAFKAALVEARQKGLPVGLSLTLPGRAAPIASDGLLVPLTRATGEPWWLLLLDLPADASIAAGGVQRAVQAADRVVQHLWQAAPGQRRLLAQLHHLHDEILRLGTRPETSNIEAGQLDAVVASTLEELHELHPERPVRMILVPPASPIPAVSDSAGLAARAVRTLLSEVLARSSRDGIVELNLEPTPTEVRLNLRGAPIIDLTLVRSFSDPIGGTIEHLTLPEGPCLRLSWPRA